MDIFIFEEIAKSHGIAALLLELEQQIAAPASNILCGKVLEKLHKAILLNFEFLERHPDALFQCLWNHCWWYDCPQASTFYRSNSSQKYAIDLYALLEHWRQLKYQRSPNFVWVRSLRPPRINLDSPFLFSLPLTNSPVYFFAFSENDSQILLGNQSKSEYYTESWNWKTKQREKYLEPKIVHPQHT
jgi:hypothetical protein